MLLVSIPVHRDSENSYPDSHILFETGEGDLVTITLDGREVSIKKEDLRQFAKLL